MPGLRRAARGGPEPRNRRRGHRVRRRTRGGARTHDHKIKSLALCRLSYPGGCCVVVVVSCGENRAPTVGMRLIHWATKTCGGRPRPPPAWRRSQCVASSARGAVCQSSPGLEPGISCCPVARRGRPGRRTLRQQVSILRPLGYGPSTLPLRHVARCSLSMLGSNQRPTD